MAGLHPTRAQRVSQRCFADDDGAVLYFGRSNRLSRRIPQLPSMQSGNFEGSALAQRLMNIVAAASFQFLPVFEG